MIFRQIPARGVRRAGKHPSPSLGLRLALPFLRSASGQCRGVLPGLLAASILLPAAHAQFDLQDSGTTSDLRGIVSVGNGAAWASGSNGTVLRTEDSGFVWQGCTVPPGAEHLDFRGIQAFDDQTAVVMSSGTGNLSRVYKTEDGCLTWKLVFTNPDPQGFFDAIQFRQEENRSPGKWGILVGDPVKGRFSIFTTSDRGDTWVRRAPYSGQTKDAAISLPGEGMFAASNRSVATPALGSLFAIVTGGPTGSRLLWPQAAPAVDGKAVWEFTAMQLPFAASASAGAFAIASTDPASPAGGLMIVGGDYKSPENPAPAFFLPHLGASAHAVLSDLRSSIAPPHGFRSAVAWDAPSRSWIAVGPNGTDISRDNGLHWAPLLPGKSGTPGADRTWNALSLPFVVGPRGRIGRLREDALPAPRPTPEDIP